QKTFSSEESLIQAHALRRRADAILTGSGTVLADDPSFTVRKVPDHAERARWLIVLDRRRRVPEQWMDRAAARGLKARRAGSLEEALDFLGSEGCLEVLVEAGPELTRSVIESGLWDEDVVIRAGAEGPGRDRIETTRRKGP
ncbi:MAG: RibD family protein, partial [Bdellovibrionales bacterium]|nr:RibD family protein [Bdellovibrionales bacterium]